MTDDADRASTGWTARWIEADGEAAGPAGARATLWFRGRFTTPSAPAPARLRITAHGVYEAFLDGVRIGDEELTPGFTQYEHRLQVQTFDVTDRLRPGVEQELAVEVSDGWWRGQVGLFRAADQWGPRTGLLAQLEADGATLVATDGSWTWAASNHIADLIEGETLDLAHPGPQGAWRPVALADTGTANLVTSPAPPVRRVEELRPIAVRRVPSGQVVDFGQNVNGWVRLARLGAPGSRLRLVHGEALDPAGDVTRANIVPDLPFLPAPLSAGQVDTVLVGDDPDAVAEPRHSTKGFRYLRIEGLDHDVEPADVAAVVVHTDMGRRGWFRCGDERLNRLHDAVVWSFRGNACDIPTDCPTRERAGWTGDWAAFLPTAAFLFDVGGFATKWLRDLLASQGPDGRILNMAPAPRFEASEGPTAAFNGSAGWGDAVVLAPWEQYVASGDPAVLAEAWPAIDRWIGFAQQAARIGRHPDRVAAHPDPLPHEADLWDSGFHFGEWLEPVPEVEGDFAAFLAADKADVATAYLRRSTAIAGRIAGVLGRTAEAEELAEYSERVRDAWTTEFVDGDGRVTTATQANCVRALAFDLVPEQHRGTVAAQLVELVHDAGDHLRTGFLATPLLLPALADAGRADLACTLLLQDTWPSWLGMIDAGATTMWERWTGYDEAGKPVESHNHYAKGAVAQFLHEHVAGIKPLTPGYRRFAVAPVADARLGWAEATHDSPFGRIRSRWDLRATGVHVEVEVPPGTECEVTPPGAPTRVVGPGAHRFVV